MGYFKGLSDSIMDQIVIAWIFALWTQAKFFTKLLLQSPPFRKSGKQDQDEKLCHAHMTAVSTEGVLG